jgi:replicative DNA helicase
VSRVSQTNRITGVEGAGRALSLAEFEVASSGYQPSFERTPPQDLTAEQCVLGGMLLSKDAIADVVEVLRPGDFY